ncbi:MAG: hypothetical protein EXQ48_07060 [Acidobacteria bacterium]|nr:hypothetical protein [Acidobacteriota bacterium]
MVRLLRLTVPLWVTALVLLWEPRVSSHNPITTTVLFNREVATLLNQKCAQCHVERGLAMPLLTYAQVRPWAVAIKEEILAKRMPPWSAERGFGAFANDVGLTTREQEFLISWIDGGVPEGTGEPPPFQDHSEHWMLGSPDAVYEATPASAGTDGLRFTIDPGFRKDTWVRAFDFKPGDRAMRSAFLSVAGSGDYLGGWTPWQSFTQLPAGSAFKLPAKARLVVDAQHTASPATSGANRLGLYFADRPSRTVTSLMLTADQPSDTGRVRVEQVLETDTTLIEVRVDMSAGGRSLELKAERPDGSFEPLVWIRNVRHDWPTPYVFRSPVSLPRGSKLIASAVFDPDKTPHIHIVFNALRD